MKRTEIIFVIDKSGSMGHLVSDTIGGFNSFIESQKALDGKTTLTTILFDSTWKTLHNGVDIHEVNPMTTSDYIAGGMTAMLDAIGETINQVQDRHDELGEEKPNNVLFVITTDGEENYSCKFNKSQIEKMIKHQTNGHGWNFMFLGANMDAVKEAESIGIKSDYAVNYDYSSVGTRAVYDTMACVASAACCDALTKDFSLSSAYASSIDNLSADVCDARIVACVSELDSTLSCTAVESCTAICY